MAATPSKSLPPAHILAASGHSSRHAPPSSSAESSFPASTSLTSLPGLASSQKTRARSKTPRMLPTMVSSSHVVRAQSAMSTDEEAKIMEEFDAMRVAFSDKKQKIYEGSVAPENRSKNRYRDVLPFEETRVKLDPVAGEAHSDYINANIIQGEVSHYEQDASPSAQHYICCQAPLPNTIYDFWRMVVQFKVPVIVMLTKLEEKSRIKAHAYWPDTIGDTHRFVDIIVTLKLQKNPRENIILRIIEVRRQLADGNLSDPHTVSHLHYTEWPDFGIPESTEVMRELIKELDIRKTAPKNPIVVHCSAGIGRAGTFLAIHIALQKHLTNPHQQLNIRDTVLKLRQQRHGMIQSKDQYKFVYATLREAIEERSSSIAARPVPDAESRPQRSRPPTKTISEYDLSACSKRTASPPKFGSVISSPMTPTTSHFSGPPTPPVSPPASPPLIYGGGLTSDSWNQFPSLCTMLESPSPSSPPSSFFLQSSPTPISNIFSPFIPLDVEPDVDIDCDPSSSSSSVFFQS